MDMRTTFRSIFNTAVIVVWLFAPSPSTGSANTDTSTSSRFRAADIMGHIKFLASDSLEGRRGGSRGGRIAAEYIRDHFRDLGLEPAGEKGGFFQEFFFVSKVVPGCSNEFVVRCQGRNIHATYGTDFSPLGSSASKTAEGPVVFIGYGLRNKDKGYDDLAGVNLQGAVAIALDGVPPELEEAEESRGEILLRKKAMLAREAGAAGLVIVREKESEMPMERLTYDGMPGDVGIAFVQVSREFAARLFECGGVSIEAEGPHPPPQILLNVTARLVSDVRQVRATGRNVIATLAGNDAALRDQYVVIGAHYDHLGTETAEDGSRIVYNGADDNASGVAGLLELAATLSENRPRRSVLFISFDAEELGALGSLHFMKEPTVPREEISAMINLDMIGRMREGTLIASGYDTSPEWEGILDRSKEGLDLVLKKSAGGFGGSDQTAFYKDNIPVLFFFTGAHDDYHAPSDDWGRINAEGEALILEYVERVIGSIGNADEPPPFKRSEAAKEKRGGRHGLPVYMGTVPDYAYEGQGFAIIGTKEGSPAERAGLRKGDVIVRMDGTEVRNIYDFMGVLSGQKPGNVIDVVVLREGKKVSLPVTLGKK